MEASLAREHVVWGQDNVQKRYLITKRAADIPVSALSASGVEAAARDVAARVREEQRLQSGTDGTWLMA